MSDDINQAMTNDMIRAQKHFFSSSSFENLIPGRIKKAKQIACLVRKYIEGKQVKKALSIGSSYCILETQLKKEIFPEAEFICTDLDKNALWYFKDQPVHKKVMSATALKFEKETFDFIFAHQVLEHINEYPGVLDSLQSLCRHGGIIYINVPNPLSPMIAKWPNGEWQRPLMRALIHHNVKKLKDDFLTNTEAYHTGFTVRTLRKYFPGFKIYDVRKDRLKQEFCSTPSRFLIDIFPSFLLFLFVETNIWILVKQGDVSQTKKITGRAF